ncbi:MAG: lipid asymmetry maintenance protein MlaB [Geobacteraceae bacterium]
MKCSLEQSEETAKFRISGSMTIEDAANLKNTITGIIAESSLIEIYLSETETTDLSCLQVLCAAHRAAVLGGKKLVLRNVPDSLHTCLEDAGFPRQAGCLHLEGEICLWQEEKHSH